MKVNWPNDFDGAHSVGPIETPKIYESPDRGKTIYERDFGSTERRLIKTSVQQQWNITFNGMKV
jgi:hypothetical protein